MCERDVSLDTAFIEMVIHIRMSEFFAMSPHEIINRRLSDFDALLGRFVYSNCYCVNIGASICYNTNKCFFYVHGNGTYGQQVSCVRGTVLSTYAPCDLKEPMVRNGAGAVRGCNCSGVTVCTMLIKIGLPFSIHRPRALPIRGAGSRLSPGL